jgi:CHAD domain-containing protein
VVCREPERGLREELRWLTGACSPVRDLDVLTAALREHPALGQTPLGMDGLLGLLVPLREQARTEMIAVLRSERFSLLLRDIEEIHDKPAPDSAAGEPVARLGPRWIRRSLNKVRREGLTLGPGEREPDSHDLHRLRIVFKGVRYTCEFFREILPPEELEPVLGLLVAYQDCLGKFQDAQVALGRLESIIGERWQASPPALDAALSLGAAMHVFREQAARSRSEFLARWPSFDAGVRDFRRVLRDMIGEESATPGGAVPAGQSSGADQSAGGQGADVLPRRARSR